MQQPIAASPMGHATNEMAHPPNNNVVPVDYPEEECADLWSNKDIFLDPKQLLVVKAHF